MTKVMFVSLSHYNGSPAMHCPICGIAWDLKSNYPIELLPHQSNNELEWRWVCNDCLNKDDALIIDRDKL